jgi:hypothetical protein
MPFALKTYLTNISKNNKPENILGGFMKTKLVFGTIFIIFFTNSCAIIGNIKTSINLRKDKRILERILLQNEDYKKFNGVCKDGELYAFQHGFSLLDNWHGIVYDNTGILDQGIEIIKNNMGDYSSDPNGYYYKDEYQKIKKLFRGDIVWIEKIEENWYYCSFT